MTPMKSIRQKCLDCCCGRSKEVRLCSILECSLWPYRFGKRPTADMQLSLEHLNHNADCSVLTAEEE